MSFNCCAVFKELAIMLTDYAPEVSLVENKKLQTVGDILDLVSGRVPLGVNVEAEEADKAFFEKLHGEIEDEYNFSWGKYENGEHFYCLLCFKQA
jgi:hypothetical protein